MRNASVQIDDHRPMISWGAIIAGALVAFIINIGLLSLGSGIGFTSFDPAAGDSLGRGALIMAGIYTVVTALLSFFAGAFVSAKMAGYRVRTVSALHGLSSWAVVSTLTVLLVGMGIGKIAGAALGLVSESVRGAVSVGASAAGSAVDASRNVDVGAIRNSIKKTMKQNGVNPEEVEQKAKALPKEMAKKQANGEDATQPLEREADKIGNAVNEDTVAAVVAQKMGITKEEAKSLLNQGEDKVNEVLSQIGQQSKEIGLQAAQATTDAAGKAGLLTFVILLLGAGAAIMGGFVGGPREDLV